MVTEVAFTALVLLIGLQRLFEVRRSRAHEHRLRAAGAREHAAWQVRVLAALHAAWLASAVVEVWTLAPPFRGWLAFWALVLLAAGQLLRRSAMSALGERWTIRVMTLPGAPPVVRGPYRHLRHPNYVGVVLEIAALPLVHGAVWTAGAFSVANLALLAVRIRAEEAALGADNAYEQHFGSRRLVSGGRVASREADAGIK